jgi:hypothetical protein
MEPKRLKDMKTGETLMLAREIMERTQTSQVYEKIDDRTVRNHQTGETVQLTPEELVMPFDPAHVAKT